ncbi:YolD-like family protein [Paenibacillus polysaccharolyticus]|uniref:YolD-like family protein n=1 Tax=Paenibacillus polysaccharolyticus TaxID=582692 RepID=UPI00203D9D84|nr:YolD-like family protein [Paenibacillus polysaccharolyticus]MCM3131927.1 YolD-like family protein [Paenibacillus polysaccharolyticus]
MASKLHANGVYEGSRMILPEHREAYLAEMEEQKRRGKPQLDEQEIQRIGEVLVQSYKTNCSVDLVVFNPFEDEPVTGVVVGLDNQTNRVKLMLDDDFRWIQLAEIMSANV